MITLTHDVLLTPNSPHFPAKLLTIPQVPTQLYATATFTSLLTRPIVAIVGSRKLSMYGQEVTTTIARQLTEQGVVIVSGLALGVDVQAHLACLEAGGATIAVLPGPIGSIYPASHHAVAQRILQRGGALVSEYASGDNIMKYQFIARNRLIAGLADAVVITEAAAGSGSLHTAQFATEQGTTVFAVPGSITSQTSVGTNNLLKTGALLATSAQDILDNLGISAKVQQMPTSSDPAQQTILDLLQQGIRDGDHLLEQSKLDIRHFNQSLTMLEIAGHIKPLGANNWSL